jgi:hypothetical protein
MSVLRPFPPLKFVERSLMVFAIFMLIDFLYYGLIAQVNPYSQDLLHKIIWTLVLAFAFTYTFYRFNSNWWIPVKGNNPVKDKHAKRKALSQGVFFGLIMGVAFIAIIALSNYILMYTLIHILDAFRGVPESGVDDAIIIIEAGTAGALLAHTGREESDVDRQQQTTPPAG